MYAFSSNSRGAMRQCDPVNVVRRLFGPKSRRNLSAASVLHIDEKAVGGRERFLAWLKDIFNKPAEDRSHEADTSIVAIDRAATTFDHPEITVSKRPADSSGKVGVINQKLANFNTMQSMTKFVDGNFRSEKYNAKNGKKRANAIQQSTTYIPSQSSELGKISQRETDSNFAWFDPGEIHRSERIVMKFAARDDSDVAAHYRRYTSPRHCYRLPPRMKQPFLESCALNRNIGVLSRAIADFAPRNSKPPVREPNMPEKREKTEKKKEKKKPVIRTDGESANSSEDQAEMIANDNPKSNPDTGIRYEWGVKLAEEPAVEASDNDNLAEKNRRYVTKQFWGVNLKQSKPDVEDAPSSEGPERTAEEHRNTSPISESNSDTIAERSNASSSLNASTKVPDVSNLKRTTAEYLSTPSYQAISPSSDSITPQQGKTDADSPSEAFQRIMKTKEPITIDEEYNVPEGASLNTEITAWKILAMKSNTIAHKEDHMSLDNVENMEMVSIRPEAPQPKLDVRVVKSTEDTLEEIDQSSSGYKTVKPTETKHFGSPQKPDGYVSSKRHLHTASVRYIHRYISSIATLSINSVLIDKTTRMKCSRFTSAFSTNSENSKEVIIKTLNQQSKEKLDSKSWKKEEKSNDSNNSLNIKRSHLESRTFSNSKKPSDADNLAETLNVIADKETEISLKESQIIDHSEKIAPLSSESVQKDESRFKDEDVQDEIERYENSSYIDTRNKHATYIDFDTPSINPSDPTKSPNAKLSEGDSKSTIESDTNATLNPNKEDEYIIDGDYVRFPGDPYPYNKENLDKWRASHFIRRPIKPVKSESKFDSVSITRSRNTNDNAYTNVARDSHADAAMKTSGSGDGAGAKNAEHSGSGFHRVSSESPQSQRAVSDCLRGDAADGLGLRGWTEAFSRLDVGDEMDEAAVRGGGGGDDASSRVYHR